LQLEPTLERLVWAGRTATFALLTAKHLHVRSIRIRF